MNILHKLPTARHRVQKHFRNLESYFCHYYQPSRILKSTIPPLRSEKRTDCRNVPWFGIAFARHFRILASRFDKKKMFVSSCWAVLRFSEPFPRQLAETFHNLISHSQEISAFWHHVLIKDQMFVSSCCAAPRFSKPFPKQLAETVQSLISCSQEISLFWHRVFIKVHTFVSSCWAVPRFSKPFPERLAENCPQFDIAFARNFRILTSRFH